MSTMPDGRPVEHLGDGVYAIYEAHGIWLHANHHLDPTDKIWIENNVLALLQQWKIQQDMKRQMTDGATKKSDL